MAIDLLPPVKITGEIIYLFFYGIYSYLVLLFRTMWKPSLKPLDGEIVLITGSARGIGREIALQLAKDHPKLKLVLWDFNEAENEETALEAENIGAQAFHYKVDISDRGQVEETAAKVVQEVGNVTILFNNAGLSGSGELLKVSPQTLEKTIQVNLISHFWTLRAFLPKMIEVNHGHIVTIGSGVSFKGLRYSSAYSASKYAIRGYLEALRGELSHHPLKPTNIKFTTVFPSFVHTPMTSNLKVEAKFGMGTFLGVREVANTIIQGVQQNQENIFLPGRNELPLRMFGYVNTNCTVTVILKAAAENFCPEVLRTNSKNFYLKTSILVKKGEILREKENVVEDETCEHLLLIMLQLSMTY